MIFLFILLVAAWPTIQPAAAASEYKRSGSIREILPPIYKRSGAIREILPAESDADKNQPSPAVDEQPDPKEIKPSAALDPDSGPDKTKSSAVVDEKPPPEQTPSPAADDRDLKLALKTLTGNIRKNPGIEGKVVETLYRGDTVSLIDRQGEWLAVRLQDGKTGWAHRSLFSAAAPDTVQTGGADRQLSRIRIAVYSENEERLLISLSGFSTPNVFTVPGNRPAVVCDFPETRCGEGVSFPEAQPKGLIRHVTVRPKGTGTRVVVSLSNTHDYDIEQIFFSAENIYALIFKKG
jgi:hypothetical protein